MEERAQQSFFFARTYRVSLRSLPKVHDRAKVRGSPPAAAHWRCVLACLTGRLKKRSPGSGTPRGDSRQGEVCVEGVCEGVPMGWALWKRSPGPRALCGCCGSSCVTCLWARGHEAVFLTAALTEDRSAPKHAPLRGIHKVNPGKKRWKNRLCKPAKTWRRLCFLRGLRCERI